MSSEYKDDELVELTEEQFLQHGELDPEMEYIVHFDHRVFDYIAKDIGMAADIEKFCLCRNYFPVQETSEDGKKIVGVYVDTEDELYQDIVASMINEMEARKNPNV